MIGGGQLDRLQCVAGGEGNGSVSPGSLEVEGFGSNGQGSSGKCSTVAQVRPAEARASGGLFFERCELYIN